jgi:hypothetical protein
MTWRKERRKEGSLEEERKEGNLEEGREEKRLDGKKKGNLDEGNLDDERRKEGTKVTLMEGRKDGRTEGWKDGRMKGRTDGRTEGMKEGRDSPGARRKERGKEGKGEPDRLHRRARAPPRNHLL